MSGRGVTRFLVWTAFAGQAAFVASWVVAGAIEPRYTHVDQGVSELAARDAAHPAIAASGIVVLGLSIVALAAALARVLPRRGVLAVALFAAAGVALAALGPLQLDCGLSVDHHCRALWHAGRLSWREDAHLEIGAAAQLLLLATPFALARALWPGTAAAAALHAGATGLLVALLSFVAFSVPGAAGGLVQRADLALVHLWVLIVGGGILYATRGEPRRSPLIPMRPRDFFAQSWTGEGELLLRPFFLGRRFAQRVDARRESTWISDRVWRIDDESHFGRGHFERRTMYCEFVADDRVRLTATDLIDGVDVWLEEGGFRLAEWRMAWPIGPLPLIVRGVDRSYFEPDGTFVNVIDLLALGIRIPVARVTFRMRPADARTPQLHWEHALEELA